MKRFIQLIIVLGLLFLVSACQFSYKGADLKAPTPVDTSRFFTGDPAKRPEIVRSEVLGATLHDGWLVVPQDTFEILITTNRAENLEVRAFVPGNDQINPQTNGLLETVYQRRVGTSVEWLLRASSPGGSSLAIYTVVENEFGRVLGPVHFIRWDYTKAR